MLLYISALVISLYKLTLWAPSHTTTTIFWTAAVAFVTLLNINSITEDEHYFKKSALDQVRLLVLFEFVINFYVLSLWLELVIVPVTAVIGGMLAVAESDLKYKAVKTLLDSVLIVFGLALISFSLYRIATDFGAFTTSNTVVDLVLPPIMSLGFLPFIYFMALFVRYENLFIRLQFFIRDRSLLSFAKRKTFVAFNFRLNLLNRWAREVGRLELESKEDVVNAIASFKNQQ